jgi:anti-anti-sigma factor
MDVSRYRGNAGFRSDPVMRISRTDASTTVALAGELDMHAVTRVRDCLREELLRRPREVVVAMNEVDLVDSSALALFLWAERVLRDSGSSLHLVGVKPPVRRAFAIANLDTAISIKSNEPSETQAA